MPATRSTTPSPRPRATPIATLCALALLTGACAEGDPLEPIPPAPTREEQFRPPDPTANPDAPIPGIEDMDASSDMADMGPDSADMEPGQDMTPAPDQDPSCDTSACALGETRCTETRLLETCEENAAGCPEWGPGLLCPGETRCIQDQCRGEDECVDLDNDGYGEGCLNGLDCDDGNPERHSDKIEVCDGIDNDCNNLIDDGVPGVGDACMVGLGACAAPGSQSCDVNGGFVCNGTPGTPTTESCDGIDNDCDGVVDNGACMQACSQDPQEPNDTLQTAFPLLVDQPVWGFTCGSDQEYYALNTTVGVENRIYAAFPNANADLEIRLFKDGAELFTTTSSTDHEGIKFTPQAGSTYVAQILNPSGQDNFYRLSLIDDFDCDSEDAFENNNTISTATLIPSGWRTRAFMCYGAQDWYFLGMQPAGTTIDFDLYFTTGFFGGGDLDVALYGDQDGDNTYEIIKEGTTGGDNEFLSHTTTWAGNYFVRVYGYLDSEENDYELHFTQ